MKLPIFAYTLTAIIFVTALTPSSTTLAIGQFPSKQDLGSSGLTTHKAKIATEALLAKTLLAIASAQFDVALVEIDKVISGHPNFRLAHLIKGDLLMVRARPFSDIGSASNGPSDRIADLGDEAKARLIRHQQQRPPHRVPSYLLQMSDEQKYAFIVDTSKYTLYVYANDNGTPRYVADYYTTIGRNGSEKFREGDKRTPIGVYQIIGKRARPELDRIYGNQSALYGSGALPLNYPNAWDQRRGRDGHGIWIHGVPFETFSRPPRASDGCVALSNEDLEIITPLAQIGKTTVIITPNIDWVEPPNIQSVKQSLQQSFESWRLDWESLNADQYLKHYSSTFSSGSEDLKSWSLQKRRVNSIKSWIKVNASEMSMYRYPGNDNLAVVNFTQNYTSSNLSNVMRKIQYWQLENKQWRIVYEGEG